jgi:PAS domain S-box-containing protein
MTRGPGKRTGRATRAGPAKRRSASAKARPKRTLGHERLPELQLIYETAPVGLAFLSPDCRYVHINQRLTEICGIPVADHIGRSVRDTVPQVADQVENIVATVIRSGEPIMGVQVHGQRADKLNADHVWMTNWYPLKNPAGAIVGVNVVAEDITERSRSKAMLTASETALRESESRFRELADNISQLVWMADQAGSRYWYNKRWYDYTGTTIKQMQEHGWQRIHHPGHRRRVEEHIRQSFQNGKAWEDTFPLRSRDGDYRWFLSRALPIRNASGKIIRWFGTHTDVTEQIAAEKALRDLNDTLEQRVETETRERLHIWNVSQDLLVVADMEGKYLSVNPAWTTILGWSAPDLLGKSSQWLLHPDDQETTLGEIGHLAVGRKTRRFESRLRHKNGSYRWVSWKAVPEQGRIYALGRDVTEIKAAENEFREARRELGQVARRTTLAAMTATIAHEIKQPLGAAVTNANAGLRWLARSPPDLTEVRDTLTNIAADCHRASELIQSVRAMFSKNEQAGAPIDINELVRETIGVLRSDLEAAGVAVRFDLSPQLTPLSGNKVQLQQVVLNIVSNAIDAMRPVTDRARVLAVKSASKSDDIVVTIEDTGMGVEAQYVDRVFEPFFTTKANGMGMGLAICRSIVEAHGGRLSMSPGVAHGSAFHVHLPGSQ